MIIATLRAAPIEEPYVKLRDGSAKQKVSHRNRQYATRNSYALFYFQVVIAILSMNITNTISSLCNCLIRYSSVKSFVVHLHNTLFNLTCTIWVDSQALYLLKSSFAGAGLARWSIKLLHICLVLKREYALQARTRSQSGHSISQDCVNMHICSYCLKMCPPGSTPLPVDKASKHWQMRYLE